MSRYVEKLPVIKAKATQGKCDNNQLHVQLQRR